jgi:hypothetical protein
MKHRIAVQTPTNVKMASLDQDLEGVLRDVWSSGLVGSAVGSAVGSVRIGRIRMMNDKCRRDIMTENA